MMSVGPKLDVGLSENDLLRPIFDPSSLRLRAQLEDGLFVLLFPDI